MPFLSSLKEIRRNFPVHSGSSLIKELCPCNTSTSEAEAGRWIRGHPQLHRSLRRAWLREVLSHKCELTFCTSFICHLKLAAGPPQFAETAIFICKHMKWQCVEHSAFAFTLYAVLLEYFLTPPLNKDGRTVHPVAAPASPLTLLGGRPLMPVLCAIALLCSYLAASPIVL